MTAGAFTGEFFGAGEHQDIVSGNATVTSEDGTALEIRPGMTLFTPDGWRGRWEVREPARTVFTIWKTA